MRKTDLLVAALAFAGTSACSDAAPSETAIVQMVAGPRFDPISLRVRAGATVTFANASAEAHTVTADAEEIPGDAQYFASGGFETEDDARDNLADGIIGQEGEYEVTFGVAGTYEYFCIPHESQGMRGTIVVEE